MWTLVNIKAQNICAFKDLDYSPKQECTTLIFGNNLDNESQGSNGSGKSALIEAIAIGFTGDSLRKVKADEIINDSAESAQIVMTLRNNESNDVFVIDRTLDRKSPQQITTTINGEPVVQPSVLEYNKFILETIGLTREDIFSNYILSKHKYSSFLNASDREKKDLINRFSNGSMVDESLELLLADMTEVRSRLGIAEKEVATCQGRVDAINEQIITVTSEYEAKKNRKNEIIAAHRGAIANNRESIRKANEKIETLNIVLERQDAIDEKLRNMEEDSNVDTSSAYSKIIKLFKEDDIKLTKNYDDEYQILLSSLVKYRKKAEDAQDWLSKHELNVNKASKELDDLKEQLETLEASQVPESCRLNNEIKEAQKLIGELENENRVIHDEIKKLNIDIDKCERILAGTIECPECHHKFLLGIARSVDEVRKGTEGLKAKLEKKNKASTKNQVKIEAEENRMKENRQKLRSLAESTSELSQKVRDAVSHLNSLHELTIPYRKDVLTDNRLISTCEENIQNLRQKLFDDAFDSLDAATKEAENSIKSLKIDIFTWEGNISTYQEAIKETQSISIDEALKSLEEKKEEYGKALITAISQKETIENELNELVAQEARFIDFKTHLANSKIEALGVITNEFLEAIGCDIRISFSGYTTLKSGKIRDKISISVLRDGIDCGSFAKMSQGEQCRANLASILALHKLTNMNCQDEKGLDLLVLDEILDATDESGLANMFEALNTLKITALVVSHGLIHESYPYRLTVTKQNGVSTLNENEQ